MRILVDWYRIPPEDVTKVLLFLRWIRQGVRRDASDHMNPMITIWYDSVTIKGDLKWQNSLNDRNCKFFNVVDGVFLNYNWTEDHLRDSKTTAGPFRQYDVFVGIDVFGRGCPGGGGWNTCEAARIIESHDMSAAIFAPGWVLECNDARDFVRNQSKFWSLLAPHLPSHPLYNLPISTSFCLGYGNKFTNGKKTEDVQECDAGVRYWYDLSSQGLQPDRISLASMEQGREEQVCAEHCVDDAWHGGGCLAFRLAAGAECCASLFKTDIPIHSSLEVRYSVRLRGAEEQVEYSIVLEMVRGTDSERPVSVFCPSRQSDLADGQDTLSKSGRLEKIAEAASHLAGYSWWHSTYLVDKSLMDGCSMTAVKVRLENKGSAGVVVLLGQLDIHEVSI